MIGALSFAFMNMEIFNEMTAVKRYTYLLVIFFIIYLSVCSSFTSSDSPSMILPGSLLPNLLILSDLLSCLDEALTLASLKKA